MKQKSLWTLVFLFCSLSLFAQNVRVDGTVQSRSGAPAPGAFIAICSQPAVTTTAPCTPLVPICSSPTDGVCSQPNPVQADGLGNYFFYVAPGTYTRQFFGNGLTTRVQPDQDFSHGGGGGGTITGITTGSGLSGGGTFGTIAIALAACPNGQVQESIGGGGWTCASVGGTGNVNTVPAAAQNQNIVQQPATQFSANNLANVRYVTPSFNWSQSITSTLTGGTPVTITLTPCPTGIFGSDTTSYVSIVDDFNREAALLTGGGSCVPGAASGTITFTPTNNHINPYTIGSASTGIQEAVIDAEASGTGLVKANWSVRLSPTNPPTTSYYQIYAPITIGAAIGDLDGNGATTICDALSKCFFLPVNSNEVTIHGFRIGSSISKPGAAITQTACSANVSTITTTLHPPINEWVDIQNTDDQHYWGIKQVATSSGSAWTYTDTNCGGATTIAPQTTPGGNALERAWLEDNGQEVTIRDVNMDQPGGFTGVLNHVIVVDNDQDFTLAGIHGTPKTNADSSYQGSALYAPGTFATNAALGRVKDSNFSMGCSGAAINWLSGNTLSVSDTVIQAFSTYAITAGTNRGGFGTVLARNVYTEIGGCANPLFVAAGLSGICGSATASGCNVGGITMAGGYFKEDAGFAGSSGTIFGGEPVFASGGATTYEFWIVAHDTTAGTYSTPLRLGHATPTATFTMGWPRITPVTVGDTITYDILATTGTNYALSAPFGTGNFLVNSKSGVAQCSGLVCTVSIAFPLSFSSITVGNDPVFYPYLTGWMGNTMGGQAQMSIDVLGAPVNCTSQNIPCVFTNKQDAATPGTYVSALAGNSVGNNNGAVGSTVLQNGIRGGGPPGNLKGRLMFSVGQAGSVNSGCTLTLNDSSPGKTWADPNHRPTFDAQDVCIGLDTGSTGSANANMAFMSPTNFRFYPGSATPLDGLTWAATLSNASLTLKVPFCLAGATSGSACIGAAAVAGTPSRLLLPTTDPTNGQVLTAGTPSGGTLQASWATPTSGFTAGTDLSGNSTNQTVIGLEAVPFCSGFTPANGQAVQYSTGLSPNPCWTAAAFSGSVANQVKGQPTLGITASTLNSSPGTLYVSAFCQATTSCNPGGGVADESQAIAAAVTQLRNGGGTKATGHIVDDMCGVETWSVQPFNGFAGLFETQSNCSLPNTHIISLDGVSTINLPASFTWRGSGGNGQSQTPTNSWVQACNPILQPCVNGGFSIQQGAIASTTYTAASSELTITLTAGAPFTTCGTNGICSQITTPSLTQVNAVQQYRLLCINNSSQPTNNGCWTYKTTVAFGAPQSFKVNVPGSGLVSCAASCGTVYLETPMISIGNGGGNGVFWSRVDGIVLNGSYLPGVGGFVNAQGEEGSGVGAITVYNTMAYYGRLDQSAAFGALPTGDTNSGPYGPWSGQISPLTCNNATCSCAGDTLAANGGQGSCSSLVAGTPGTVNLGNFLTCGGSQGTTQGQFATINPDPCTNPNFVGFLFSGAAQNQGPGRVVGHITASISDKSVGSGAIKQLNGSGTITGTQTATTASGVMIIGSHAEMDDLHMEFFSTDIEIGGNLARNATWQLAYSVATAGGAVLPLTAGVIIDGGFNAMNSGGTGVDIAQAGAGALVQDIDIKAINVGTGTGNALEDNISGTSCSDATFSYFLGHGTNPLVINSCSTVTNVTANSIADTALNQNAISFAGVGGLLTGLNAPAGPAGVAQSVVFVGPNPPQVALPGVVGRAVTGATSTDTIASTDCSNRIEYVGSVAVAIALPTATTLQVPACIFKMVNNLSTNNDLTITTTTWTCNGAATCVLHRGQEAVFFVDPNSATNWAMDANEQVLLAGSGVTFTRTATSNTIAVSIAGTADAALDNLAAVAINLGLTPGVTNTIDLGSNTKYWANLWANAINCGIAGTASCTITGAGSTSGTATVTWPAVAGTITNPITISNSVQLASGTVYSINGDTGISRIAAGVFGFGNGTAGNSAARLRASAYMSVGTTFTSNAGCTEGTLVGGASAGKFTVGQNTACTIIITMGNAATAINGWSCWASDQTAVPAVAIRQTASTTTTASLLMTVATNDVVTFGCIGY